MNNFYLTSFLALKFEKVQKITSRASCDTI